MTNNNIKYSITIFFFLISLGVGSIDAKEVKGKGQAILHDDITPNEAKKKALKNATQDAIGKFGLYVKVNSEYSTEDGKKGIQDYYKDYISTGFGGNMKEISKKYTYEQLKNGNSIVMCEVILDIDEESFDNFVRKESEKEEEERRNKMEQENKDKDLERAMIIEDEKRKTLEQRIKLQQLELEREKQKLERERLELKAKRMELSNVDKRIGELEKEEKKLNKEIENNANKNAFPTKIKKTEPSNYKRKAKTHNTTYGFLIIPFTRFDYIKEKPRLNKSGILTERRMLNIFMPGIGYRIGTKSIENEVFATVDATYSIANVIDLAMKEDEDFENESMFSIAELVLSVGKGGFSIGMYFNIRDEIGLEDEKTGVNYGMNIAILKFNKSKYRKLYFNVAFDKEKNGLDKDWGIGYIYGL